MIFFLKKYFELKFEELVLFRAIFLFKEILSDQGFLDIQGLLKLSQTFYSFKMNNKIVEDYINESNKLYGSNYTNRKFKLQALLER